MRRAIKTKVGQAPEGSQVVEFTRKELDETASEVNTAIGFAPSPYKKRLTAVRDKIEGVLGGITTHDDATGGPSPGR